MQIVTLKVTAAVKLFHTIMVKLVVWEPFTLINKASHAAPLSYVGCCNKTPCHCPNFNFLFTFDQDRGEL